MTPLETFLQRVEHRFTGKHNGVFNVPTRKDRHPSGTFRELDDGRVLIFDHGGDSAKEILAAVGLSITDLFPQGPVAGRAKPEQRPFYPGDALRAIAFEAMVVAAAAASLASGESIGAVDRDRLVTAAARIQAALSSCGMGGRHA